jgi:hypothetical protein
MSGSRLGKSVEASAKNQVRVSQRVWRGDAPNPQDEPPPPPGVAPPCFAGFPANRALLQTVRKLLRCKALETKAFLQSLHRRGPVSLILLGHGKWH